MVEFVNAYTGTKMFVAEARKEEYLAAGHKLAAEPLEKKEPKAEKAPAKKTTKKK